MIHLYARVSTDKQEHGREAQVEKLMQWAERHGHTDVQHYVDEDVSALSVRLQDRPAGRRMWDILAPGDTVVATKMDRMFRRLADMATVIDAWKKLGIQLILLDTDVDINTPHGRAVAGFFAVAAQLESELHGQRKREVYAHRRQAGKPYNTIRPWGWTVVKTFDEGSQRWRPTGYKVYQPERDLAQTVIRMRDRGMSWSLIADELICEGVRKPKGSRGEYYYGEELKTLVQAQEAGFPTVAQGAWRGRGRERKQPVG